jgi:signal transduction histidine kinase
MRWRFALAATLVSLVAISVLLIPLANYLRDVERDRIMTALERDAFVLAGRSEEALEDTTQVDTITAIARDYQVENGARVVITDADGIAIVTSDDDPVKVGDSYLSRPEVAAALTGEISTGTRFSTTLGIDLLYVAVPVLSGPHVHGVVRLTYPASVVESAVNDKVAALGIATSTTVLASAIVGLIFAAGVTRRLRQLRELSERFSEGDLSRRADETSGAPELRSLARSFNSMAERLADAMDQQQRFAADASHQLRTPITALRLRLDRARELAEEGRAAEAGERIAAATRETERLEELIEGLLALTRREGELARLEHVDVAALARTRVEYWRALADESEVTLVAPTTTPRLALTAPAAVEQILDTLIDNALAVSARGDTITVTVDDDLTVHVIDQGPGMTPDEIGRATERFWTTRPGGTGLGLSIATRLATTAGGRLTLSTRAEGGLDAALHLAPDWTPARTTSRGAGSPRSRKHP